MQCSGAGTGLGDGRRDYGHAALRGMRVRDEDDEGAADGAADGEVQLPAPVRVGDVESIPLRQQERIQERVKTCAVEKIVDVPATQCED